MRCYTRFGLGPCIGVALSFQGHAFMLHTANAWVESESATDPFFESVERTVTHAARQAIHPVVAGGCIESDDPETDDEINAETSRARTYVVERLLDLGFGKPGLRWCPPGHAQDLYLHIARNKR